MGIKLNQWIINWITKDRPVDDFPLSDFQRIRHEVRPCDVILVEGRNRTSDVVKFITQSSWSHAAIYVGRLHDIEDPVLQAKLKEHFDGSPDTQLIIEGLLGKGIVVSALNSYSEDHIRICRPNGLSGHDGQLVIAYAIEQLGYEYDFFQLFDMARFLIPWRIVPRSLFPLLFDNTAGKSTRTVCSTLVAEAFKSVQFPILPYVKKHKNTTGYLMFHKNPRLHTPRDFDYSPYFSIIKYPFVDIHVEAAYRNLPWGEDALMVED